MPAVNSFRTQSLHIASHCLSGDGLDRETHRRQSRGPYTACRVRVVLSHFVASGAGAGSQPPPSQISDTLPLGSSSRWGRPESEWPLGNRVPAIDAGRPGSGDVPQGCARLIPHRVA